MQFRIADNECVGFILKTDLREGDNEKKKDVTGPWSCWTFLFSADLLVIHVCLYFCWKLCYRFMS